MYRNVTICLFSAAIGKLTGGKICHEYIIGVTKANTSVHQILTDFLCTLSILISTRK
jgi:hypothetical protein